MKEHFEKLLTEQERAGSKMPSAKWGGRVKVEDSDSEYEKQAGGLQPWSRHRNQDNKSLTDVLSPLRGYLRKNVGRPWDEVYSEICWGMDKRTTTGAHIFTHLWQYVERYTFMGEDGKVKYLNRYGGKVVDVDEWYIHPVTGLLSYIPPRRYRTARNSGAGWSTEIKIEPGKCYKLLDGIWYYAEWVYKDEFVRYNPYRASLMGLSPWVTKETEVIIKKRQLGRKELRDLGLKNGVAARAEA